MSNFKSKSLQPVYNKVKDFNSRVLDRVDPKVATLKAKNKLVAMKLQYAQDMFQAFFVNNMLLADSLCPAATAATVCHPSVKSQIDTVNNALEQVENTLDAIADFF